MSGLFLLSIISLRPRDVGSLKQFLINYRNCCFEDGLTLVQDKYQLFYEVLSTKMEYPDDYLLPGGTMKLQASPSVPVQGDHLIKNFHAAEGLPKRLSRNPQKLDESMAWDCYPHLRGQSCPDVWGDGGF